MPNEFFYLISLRGVDLTPEILDEALRERIVEVSLRGEISRCSNAFSDTTIVTNVGSILEGIEAIKRVRAVHSGLIEDASLHIDYEYEAQCNLELSGDEIAALASADAALTISCWQAPVANDGVAAPVANWRPLSDIEATSFWSGTVFRFPAEWPYEAFVDYMLVSDQGHESDKLKLLATTGYKGGVMNILTHFPSEAYVAGAIAISSDWLKANWRGLVYSECEMGEVYVSKGYAVPVDTAGNMTL